MKSDLEMLNEAEENLEWFTRNSKNIQEEFGGKAIAIKDKKIVSSADSGIKLLEVLKKQNIDRSDVIIERIPPRGEIRIF
ncbi:hypothetical protein CMI42_06455 [Candidatus Pacearchaeota archaeon]|nr:hypothetical protein [Candidatus Pacearchaeota archaeon]|tara:strand:+ start:1512 stop:1751 length:240 start_codon:yes stop_codon:yes gene_type:complete